MPSNEGGDPTPSIVSAAEATRRNREHRRQLLQAEREAANENKGTESISQSFFSTAKPVITPQTPSINGSKVNSSGAFF